MTDDLLLSPKPKPTFTPKQISSFYFKQCVDDEGGSTGYYACTACGKRRKHSPGCGYTNLVSHVRTSHPNFEEDMRNASVAASGTLLKWVSQKAANRYAWMRWVILGNLPLSFCESEHTRQYTKLHPICSDTLTDTMEAMSKEVEKGIGQEMPDQYGLMLDGWTRVNEHYMAVFACYETAGGPQYPLLSFAPVMQEANDDLTAKGHIKAIERFLPYFGKIISGCKFLVGDNCSVNKKMADLLQIPLIGCASHRLNLAVQRFLEPHEPDLEEVQVFMKKLRSLNRGSKLRLKTDLAPVLRQSTRWSSTFAMLARYMRLRELISADDDELADHLPSRSVHRNLETLYMRLKDVESVSKRLQADDTTIGAVRDLFDGLIEVFPEFSSHIASHASVVHSPDFESGVVKVLSGLTNQLTDNESKALEPLKIRCEPQAASNGAQAPKESFADRILKRRKTACTTRYDLVAAIPPTSNRVERLFSCARSVLRDERQHMSPLMLEMLLFLRVNRSYWSVGTVEQCLNA